MTICLGGRSYIPCAIVQAIAIIPIFFKCIFFNLQHMFCNNKGLEDDDHMPRGEELCVPLCYSQIILGSVFADHKIIYQTT